MMFFSKSSSTAPFQSPWRSVLLIASELPAFAFSSLGSQQFSEREPAQLELLEWGRKQPDPAMDELLQAVSGCG